jgi:hypothetical protein
MYTLNMPVSTIRTKMRQEFERHRYVSKLKTADVLIYKSHAEFQVRIRRRISTHTAKAHHWLTRNALAQETLNFWKQLSHVLKYFRAEEDPKATLPKSFIAGFLQVRHVHNNKAYFLLDDSWISSLSFLCSIRHANRTFPSCRAVTKSRTLCT